VHGEKEKSELKEAIRSPKDLWAAQRHREKKVATCAPEGHDIWFHALLQITHLGRFHHFMEDPIRTCCHFRSHEKREEAKAGHSALADVPAVGAQIDGVKEGKKRKFSYASIVDFLNLFKPSTFFGSVQLGQFCQRITNLNNSIVDLNFVKKVSCSQLFPLLAVSAQLIVRVLVTGSLGPASVVMVDFTIFDPNAGKTVRTPGEPSFLHFPSTHSWIPPGLLQLEFQQKDQKTFPKHQWVRQCLCFP
jgi:hypothetical protein